MKFLHTLLAFLFLIIPLSCKNEGKDAVSFDNERDSILQDNQAKTQQLAELNGIIATIAAGLDSISVQENILYSNGATDAKAVSKQQIAAQLKGMADILDRQRRKIRALQDSLSTHKSTEGLERLQKVIDFLNKQLAEKDQVIQSLQADLNSSRKNVTQLRATLSNMQTRAEQAEKKSVVLTSALSKQDDMMNECYIRIGTKKQLSQAGLLKGGFLKKKKVNYEEVDKGKFSPVDIRSFREVTLKSSNPRILTPLPNNSSYHFEDNGDGTCTLVITNPNKFWSVSNFLIIQL